MKPTLIFSLCSLLSLTLLSCAQKHTNSPPPNFANIVRLENAQAYTNITPDLGGRLLSYGLKGKGSFIKLGEDFHKQISPEVSPSANNIGYLGHIVWIGPQTEWWTRQDLNLERKQAKASWPPDPYLIFGKNRILQKTPQSLSLQGVTSPVTGLRINKSFNLSPKDSTLEVIASAEDIHPKLKNWDIWFNTRIHPDTTVYVPVENTPNNLKAIQFSEKTSGKLEYTFAQGLMSLKATPPPPNKTDRQGKLFIQPSAGWMAGFRGDQLFIIEFKLEEKNSMLIGHDQIEIYANFPKNLNQGLIELELHAPREQEQAKQIWRLFEYKGSHSPLAQISFLKKILDTEMF